MRKSLTSKETELAVCPTPEPQRFQKGFYFSYEGKLGVEKEIKRGNSSTIMIRKGTQIAYLLVKEGEYKHY